MPSAQCPVLCCAGEQLAPHLASVLSAVAAGASHPSPLVQTAALSVIDPVLTYITDATVPAFHQLLGALLPCAQAALASGNEELLVQLCQVCVWLRVCVDESRAGPCRSSSCTACCWRASNVAAVASLVACICASLAPLCCLWDLPSTHAFNPQTCHTPTTCLNELCSLAIDVLTCPTWPPGVGGCG